MHYYFIIIVVHPFFGCGDGWWFAIKRRIRWAAFLLAALLCILPARAAEVSAENEIAVEESEELLIVEKTEEAPDEFSAGLEAIIEPFLEQYGLNENNFAMGYCYTATGDTWYYNGDALMLGGSIYKLPLNMRVTEKVAEGTLSETDRVGGYSLPQAQYLSLVHSDNAVSQAMQRYLVGYPGSYYRAYRDEIAVYSGDFQDDIPEKYYSGNYFSARFMINTLSYLYDHSEDFETILNHMKEAQPGAYFKRYTDKYVIAHKYGYIDGAINDVGIVYTDTPFLLAAFTYNTGNGEEVLGRLCALLCGYTNELDAQREAVATARAAKKAETIAAYEARLAAEAEAVEAEGTAPEETAAENPPAPVQEEAAAPETPEPAGQSAEPVWIIAAVSTAGLAVFALFDRRRRHIPI